MTLRRVDVDEAGLTRFVTEAGSRVRVTVECPGSAQAVYFEAAAGEDVPRPGEWVWVSGWGKLDSRGPADAPSLIRKPYLHDPHDGTPRSGWTFLDLRESSFRRIPPPLLAAAMSRVWSRVEAHLSDWGSSRSLRGLTETVEAVAALHGILESAARAAAGEEEARAARAAVVDVEV